MGPRSPALFHSQSSLGEALADRLAEDSWVIGVEGASTSGKTTLAGFLSGYLDASLVSTDGYYIEGRMEQTYSAGLRLDDLRSDLRRFRDEAKPVVVEGLCLRDTLAAVHVLASVFVYCRKISATGVWHESPDLTVDADPESSFVQGRIDWWSHEYHARASPHSEADFVFEWREDAL